MPMSLPLTLATPSSNNPVVLPDRYFHWPLWLVASFVVKAKGIICVVSSDRVWKTTGSLSNWQSYRR